MISGYLQRCLLFGLTTVMTAAIFLPSTYAADYVIRFSHGMPELMTSGQHAYAVTFKDYVEQATDGNIEVRILGANVAGSERTQLERVQANINQMLLVSEITQPSFFEPAMVWGIPFLFPSSPVAWEVMDSDFAEHYNQEFREATGVRVLNHIESGFRSIFNSVRPIHGPEDVQGLKIRTGENPVHMALIGALGASPTPIAWAEVYSSLQQGVVDGMENPPGLFYTMRFFEHQNYLTVNRHLYSIHSAMINEDFFQSLPGEYQDVVLEAARLGKTVGRSTAYQAEQDALRALREEGIEIHIPSPGQLSAFRELGQPPALELVRKEIGDEWVDGMLEAVEEAQQALKRR
jgi:TRAP-type transport system periplasmic protein